jgi:hypothetical protein
MQGDVNLCTAQAVTNCTVASMERKEYEYYLKHLRKDDINEENIIKWFRKTQFFNRWMKSQLKKFFSALNQCSCNRGDIVVRENEQGNVFYMIKEGEFEIIKRVNKPTGYEGADERFL